MKFKIIALCFILAGFSLHGQEIKLNAPMLTNAGSSLEQNGVNLSKWRLGEVHLIVLQNDSPRELVTADWEIKVFPNPFRKALNLDIQTKTENSFSIAVTDLTGRKVWIKKEKKILRHEVVQFDLSFLVPALYLVTITPKDKHVQSVIKVQKL